MNKIKEDQPAFPYDWTETIRLLAQKGHSKEIIHDALQSFSGLTKREYFAAMAMQGILSNSSAFYADDTEKLSIKSVDCADAIILQLNKQ